MFRVHIKTSFSAVGGHSIPPMVGHAPGFCLGEHSLLTRLEQAKARVLLLDVDFDFCTAFRLVDYLIPNPPVAGDYFVTMATNEVVTR